MSTQRDKGDNAGQAEFVPLRPRPSSASQRDGTGHPPYRGVLSVPLAEAVPDSGKLDLIVAILFELLHRATPDEAVPAVAGRLAARAPAFSEAAIEAALNLSRSGAA